jgi:hypothetical protein
MKSQNSQQFLNLLSEFAANYADRLVTTEDFINIARKYLGDRTDPFFEQWLFGWQVPKIKKKRNINRDGSVEIKMEISEIPENFETLYPIQYLFDNNKFKTVVYRLKAGENIIEFSPDSSVFVKEIKFNAQNDILEQ